MASFLVHMHINDFFFFKKYEKNFDFFLVQTFGFLKNQKKKKIKFFEKNFIIKKCVYGLKMKPCQVLGKYFEVYGQADQITPPFSTRAKKFRAYISFYIELSISNYFNFFSEILALDDSFSRISSCLLCYA